MVGKGGWLGGGRPKKPEDQQKVSLNARVNPELRAWIVEQSQLYGHKITRWLEAAIVCLRKHPEDWPQ